VIPLCIWNQERAVVLELDGGIRIPGKFGYLIKKSISVLSFYLVVSASMHLINPPGNFHAHGSLETTNPGPRPPNIGHVLENVSLVI
jgi:hypothetical protein